ncbi:tripartite tricarboxylate transporter substrate binding protein [Marinomonas rhizomae]|uniref:Bug family tripartite tricarboxylate transporter substrate binding protein n=1 Tax=Marinomonas rhizomae TaxID=491948 RepID=UPI0021068438|nr:tripartite tricarboxylate transporter substrate binding protein [Marinomonas rhizomae]UTV98425.1 tripartite tricarboxylate transporter substrate binding protein [Marinomonas rhizomae]
MIKKVQNLVKMGVCVAMSTVSLMTFADTYPSKSINIVVPFNPGGGVDTVARIIAVSLRESLGQDVIVDNKPGGSGMIGANAVAKAEPDGYTLLLGSAGETAINEFVYKSKMQYSPAQDLAPITLVTKIPNVFVVSPRLPVNNVEEFVAYAKAHPNTLTYATSGTGNVQHLDGELLKMMAGIDMTQIPYKGASKQLVDVSSGMVDATFVSYTAARSFMQNGKVKALAVTSELRADFDKSIPAVNEYPPLAQYSLENWFGMFAPAGTPREVLEKINSAVVAALKNPELSEKLNNIGGKPAPLSIDQFSDFLKVERAVFADIVDQANITIQ